MARLNSKRRRALKLREALTALGKANNPSTQADSGSIRSSAKPHVINEHGGIAYSKRAPKPFQWEGSGAAGKVVRKGGKPSKVARKLPAPTKSVVPLKPEHQLGMKSVAVPGVDTLKRHYRATWANGRPIRKEPD